VSTCPLCDRRKPRRACPARGDTICTVCCGTKRLIEIACPPDCPYLQSAERHPPASVKRKQQQDADVLLGTAVGFTEPQLRLSLLLQAVIARFKPTGLVRLIDQDVADAAGTLAATLETATRGVIYEHQSPSPVAEALRRELQVLLAEVGRGGGTRFEREAAEVLRAIETTAKHQVEGLPHGERAYLDIVERTLPDNASSGPRTPPEPGGPSIILP
jgi:hypothetical protein